jgi:dihydrofolate reductase
MRKIILTLAVSLDGFIEGPDREIDWIEFTPETGDALGRFLKEIDTVLYGRISYEMWGAYKPGTEASEFEKDFYRKLDKTKKYVFSTTKTEFEGAPTVVSDNIKETIETLKQQPGKHIWLYGGASLITTFINLDLVDEFRLAVFPVILGAGNPLFKNIARRVKLKLLKVEGSKMGIAELWYARDRS